MLNTYSGQVVGVDSNPLQGVPREMERREGIPCHAPSVRILGEFAYHDIG